MKNEMLENLEKVNERIDLACNKIQELEKENTELKKDLQTAIDANVKWLQRDTKLEEQIEKMKNDVYANIKWADQNKNNQMWQKLIKMMNEWELAE